MDCEEFLKSMETRGYIESPSEAQDCMHRLADRARKITSQMNGAYRTQEEIRALFRELTGREICEGFVLFPPFYTDCGRNIRIGNDVFINAGCCFQDQGGIFVGDGVLIGHQVVLATLNHDLAPRKAQKYVSRAHHHRKQRMDRRARDHTCGRDSRRKQRRRGGRGGDERRSRGRRVAGVPAKIIKNIEEEKTKNG